MPGGGAAGDRGRGWAWLSGRHHGGCGGARDQLSVAAGGPAPSGVPAEATRVRVLEAGDYQRRGEQGVQQHGPPVSVHVESGAGEAGASDMGDGWEGLVFLPIASPP